MPDIDIGPAASPMLVSARSENLDAPPNTACEVQPEGGPNTVLCWTFPAVLKAERAAIAGQSTEDVPDVVLLCDVAPIGEDETTPMY